MLNVTRRMTTALRSRKADVPAVATAAPDAPRRGLLGAALALPLAAAAASPALSAFACPDAGLIRRARAHERLSKAWNDDFPEGMDDGPIARAADARRDRMVEQQGELLAGMLSGPVPVTVEGLQAIAAALVVWDLELLKEGPGDAGQNMTALLVRGLLNMRGAT